MHTGDTKNVVNNYELTKELITDNTNISEKECLNIAGKWFKQDIYTIFRDSDKFIETQERLLNAQKKNILLREVCIRQVLD